jgi:hypothetical protein
LELKAEESARTFVGQNSTQNPHALQRSTTMETRPLATKNPHNGVSRTPVVQKELWFFLSQDGVTQVTESCEAGYKAEIYKKEP